MSSDNQLTRKQRFIITLTVLILLAAVETVALLCGVDGQLFTGVTAAMAGIGGFAAGRIKIT